jgi:hypothetical protein
VTSLAALRDTELVALPTALRTALRWFPGTNDMLDIWRRYPDVTEDEHEATFRWACRQASDLFVGFLAERGIAARVVLAARAYAPFHDYHWWVRADCAAGTVNVDWTARQFHDLENPPRPAHQDLPFPLMWMSAPPWPSDTHPVSGRYAVVHDPAPATPNDYL